MAKFKRTFKVTVNFSDGKYGPYVLDNIEAKDFNDVISGFLKNVELSRTGHDQKSGKPSGISANICEFITQNTDSSDAEVTMNFCADSDMVLHDLERNGLEWFREKAEVEVSDNEFAVKKEGKALINVFPKNCKKMYAILGYDNAGLQRGDVVEITVEAGPKYKVVSFDGVTGRHESTESGINNHEKYIPFAKAE